MKLLNNWGVMAIMCLALGLAPWWPEPHIWGKLRWIAGGAVDMQLMDWWDTVLHGTPWLLLVRLAVVKLLLKKKS